MVYLLDSNVFIEAKNRYYAFDICPGFWVWMDIVCGSETASIVPVRDELIAQADELATWIRSRQDNGWFYDVSDAATQQSFAQIVAQVQAGPCTSQAKGDFLGRADPWLIAKARVLGATVVTHELLRPPETIRKVAILNICTEFKVPYQNTFDLLRGLGASFGLNA